MSSDDRFAIQDVLFRYARGVDRRDWESVLACYHPDAIDDHGGYAGGRDGLIAWMRERHESILMSMHFISNVLVDFRGDEAARVESYCTTVQRMSARDVSVSLRMYEITGLESAGENDIVETSVRCRFVDFVTKGPSEWRIAKRTVVFESLDYRVFTPSPLGSGFVTGSRSRDDALWMWE